MPSELTVGATKLPAIPLWTLPRGNPLCVCAMPTEDGQTDQVEIWPFEPEKKSLEGKNSKSPETVDAEADETNECRYAEIHESSTLLFTIKKLCVCVLAVAVPMINQDETVSEGKRSNDILGRMEVFRAKTIGAENKSDPIKFDGTKKATECAMEQRGKNAS